MKIAERIIGGLAIIALAFKIFHIPGGATFSILLICLLSMFYMVLSFFLFKPDNEFVELNGFQYQKTNVLRVVGSIAAGIALATGLIGILFQLMHWPGRIMQLLIGILNLSAIGIICAIKYATTKSDYYKNIGVRIAIVGIIAFMMFFLYK